VAKRGTSVLIVGGGVAGLAAAHELRRRAPRTRLALLEARQQLGGRVLTQHDPVTGEPLELGAEFVHGEPPELLRALRSARIPVDRGEDDGESSDSPFSLLPKLLTPLLAAGGPDVSMVDFLRRQALSPHRRRMLFNYVRGFYVAPPERASALAIARMELAAAAIHGGRAGQVVPGFGALVRWLAKSLGPDELRLGAVATRLRWNRGRVAVCAASLAGAELAPLEADAAIVAVPFTALSAKTGLRLSPAVPSKRRAAAALRMGHASKLLLRFDGSVQTDPFFYVGGPIAVWWSAVSPGTRWLVGWAGGRGAEAVDRMTDAAVLRAGIAAVSRHTGRGRSALARALTGFRIARWSREPFIGGSYAWVPVGADGAMQVLAEPVDGTLFFAGEATNPEHAGTVHGAFESGVRAARQVLSRG